MREQPLASLATVDLRTGEPGSEEATILLVEDDPVLRSPLAYNLSREGFRLFEVADGESAIDLAQREEERLDLVILDIKLPGISGFHVLRLLRKASHVPVLVLSARG